MTGNDGPPVDVGRAEALLKERLAGRSLNLSILLRDGGVVLRGYAFSYHAKQLAQHFLMSTFGLWVLANEIEVRPPPGGE